MKHLPNLLTLANLFCGCIAITFILSAQNFVTSYNMTGMIEVSAVEQPYWGSVFIFLAAGFDLLDGWAARSLKIFSPLGKDLDSLADLVSFGVAPAMILFKMLWSAYMTQPDAMDTPLIVMAPAFLIACFGALRLARFNVFSRTPNGFFQGLPIPAVGIFIASFPLIQWQNPMDLAPSLYNITLLYIIIGVLCWLMVSKIRFFKFLPSQWQWGKIWPQIIIVVLALTALPYLQSATVPFTILLYIILSFVYKPQNAES